MSEESRTAGISTRLVVLRGNSGSGKSSVAKGLRARWGRGLAWVEQDHIRRVVLGESDRPDAPNIGLLDTMVRYSLANGFHVVLEGILKEQRYGSMLRRLLQDTPGRHHVYWFEIPFPETTRRHATRPLWAEVTPAAMREWYRAGDVLGVDGERVVEEAATLEETVERVFDESLGDAPRIVDAEF